ncbi:MAG: HNH endonuclease [Nanoarchaeota archaeon]|nr:HNH endonuclease [Nanoarchaeota archaeon]
MPRNPFEINIKSLKVGRIGLYDSTKKSSNGKRTLGIRDKQILYRRAKKKCESCGRKIDFDEMHSGHKNAASKGGSATLRNSVCVCARCNKLQGTDSWATFMKKMGKSNTHSVTSGKKRSVSKKKIKRNIPEGNYWINPLTGRKEKSNPFGF